MASAHSANASHCSEDNSQPTSIRKTCERLQKKTKAMVKHFLMLAHQTRCCCKVFSKIHNLWKIRPFQICNFNYVLQQHKQLYYIGPTYAK